jgi:hypothetical protein
MYVWCVAARRDESPNVSSSHFMLREGLSIWQAKEEEGRELNALGRELVARLQVRELEDEERILSTIKVPWARCRGP